MKQQPLPRGLYLLFALSVILLLANILTPRCCPPKDASRDLPTAFSPALLAVTSGAIKPCAALDASGSFNRIVFATVPRTGSTFTRYAIEKVTGIGTESFYDETTDGNRSNRTGVYGKPCGALMDCEKVHRGVGSDPVAIKSHFPFIGPDLPTNTCISAILSTVRHPLDNYIAWIHFRQEDLEKTPIYEGRTPLRVFPARDEIARGGFESFEKFGDKWEEHLAYWRGYAESKGVPHLVFRYEDLCTDPDALASSVAAFLSSGNPSSLPSRQPNLKCMLSNLVEPTWRAIVSRDEIARVLEKLEPWMVEFGYPATWEGIGETLDGKRKATAAAS